MFSSKPNTTWSQNLIIEKEFDVNICPKNPQQHRKCLEGKFCAICNQCEGLTFIPPMHSCVAPHLNNIQFSFTIFMTTRIIIWKFYPYRFKNITKLKFWESIVCINKKNVALKHIINIMNIMNISSVWMDHKVYILWNSLKHSLFCLLCSVFHGKMQLRKYEVWRVFAY